MMSTVLNGFKQNQIEIKTKYQEQRSFEEKTLNREKEKKNIQTLFHNTYNNKGNPWMPMMTKTPQKL